MKKKLWMTFGPLLVAFAVFLFVLFGPSSLFSYVSPNAVKKSATSMNESVIQGLDIQKEALREGSYLPIFGSSELSRIDPFHPSVVSQKYDQGYTPFLLGRPGTQSLSHFLDVNALGNDLKGKKVAVILSPQWFGPKGVSDPSFGANFSPLHAYKFALEDTKNTPERRYAAKRLLSFQVVQSDSTLKNLLENIVAKGPKKPHDRKLTKIAGNIELKILKRKDDLESKVIAGSKQERVDKGLKALPEKLDYNQLDQLAKEAGEKGTGTNPFQVKEDYYKKKIQPIEGELKNSRTKLRYDLDSPEYGDLQLLMDSLKKAGADVIFINPPINGKWVDYIGLNEQGLENYYAKTKQQIESQGFRYYSLEEYQNKPFYLEDPIHLSWRGWVKIDQVLADFVKDPIQTNYTPTADDFYKNHHPDPGQKKIQK
ncbi:D-alanyl-lipoteichoic acid biosynthesis protein DltD [Listeria ivanovii]|uniref:D-alanyl-lipoteichoic acid biosynthesis protein DltD n=2 Tax=Listeria ivanovii TaxID=1638 RepID=UPI000DA94D5D|nr:D-alanyl-lipoteichoic acid biosynthesis protein DltD [Listeria ivanovii]PZF87452.1 D-alanyl-lipoteichoic acid biosynthesis protein DltD [Listeria ivanovii]PZF92483.1 D-alanyl-lipoteichoic acid biosynthesis protein DltD [Listeria ivanovii]PZG03584.1 D-alanyl-lipoteichoic acid biosynthesis protein DltD [Listeria ivanovii]PZG07814.1 D-alanyl-lipoteichoic acid biosynthesis protein DltD [Listeria ivanovii]PZG24730.1 D-alanyl-lipoteichoic acid biosynthesis protein DltD [Listeria ivanovii]